METPATIRGIVYVLRSFPELSETFILREIEGLAATGIPVSVIAASRAPTPGSAPDVDTHYLTDPTSPPGRPDRGTALSGVVVSDLLRLRGHPRRSARCLRLAAWARRAARLVPPGTHRLHAHFANDAATLARYVSVRRRIPYAVTAHAYDLYQDPFLLGPNVASATRIFTVSAANLEYLRSRAGAEGWDPDRFEVLRCGVDLDALSYGAPPEPRVPARLLCVARLVPKKGHETLLRAVAQLRAGGVALHARFAGDGPLAESLHSLAANLGVAEAVEFLGPVPPERVIRLMGESDLVALASRIAPDGDRDGLPVALIEAAALGVPVAATAVAGIPELITPETGWSAPPDRPDLLAEAIRDLLEAGDEERRSRTAAARARVEAEFDLRRQIRVLGEL